MMSAQVPVPYEHAQVQNGSSSPTTQAQQRSPISITISQRSLWLMAALAVAVLVLIAVFSQALGPLILLVLAIIIGEALRPLVARLERYHIPRPLAILMIYVAVIALAGVLIWLLLVSPLLSQIGSLTLHLPQYYHQVRDLLAHLRERLHAQGAVGQAITNLAPSLVAALQQAAPALLAIPVTFIRGIVGIFISVVAVLFMTLFWLLSSPKLKEFVVGLFPVTSQQQASSVLTSIGRTFGGYVYGTLIRMAVIGTLSGIGLAILQMPYALLLGILAGVTELIPYVGPWISGSIAVTVALLAVGPAKALEVAILFLVVFELEGNVVQPLALSRTVHVDPLLVLLAVLVGISLVGIIGAILAVPLAAGAQIVVEQVIAPATRRALSRTGSSV
jgi:predicted PurR-regulated permease PerM